MREADTSATARRFGAWAALAAAFFAVAYDIPQILQVAGVLRAPWDRVLIFVPSLALAPAFVLAMAGAHAATPGPLKAWSLGALALAILYAADVSLIYVVQLGAVIPGELGGYPDRAAFAACCGPGMPATAIDVLGYTYMSLATALLAPAFPGAGLRRALRWALITNGALAPVLIGQLAWPELIWLGAVWMATFPTAMILLALALRGAGGFAPSQTAEYRKVSSWRGAGTRGPGRKERA
ncbi:MAG: hypothetical protein ABIO39_14080 [Caulobacteraceae bacterium]